MREIVFRVLSDTPGRLDAIAISPASHHPLRITAPSLEELHHEARDALIEHLGAVHGAYRVRIRRCQGHPSSAVRPLHRPAAPCS
ncbi:MAG: hypothetical protein R6U00_01850 [Prochlorococcaceae cyanobacterium]